MGEEMNALKKNQTWSLVPKPEGVHPISYKWVYIIKRNVLLTDLKRGLLLEVFHLSTERTTKKHSAR